MGIGNTQGYFCSESAAHLEVLTSTAKKGFLRLLQWPSSDLSPLSGAVLLFCFHCYLHWPKIDKCTDFTLFYPWKALLWIPRSSKISSNGHSIYLPCLALSISSLTQVSSPCREFCVTEQYLHYLTAMVSDQIPPWASLLTGEICWSPATSLSSRRGLGCSLNTPSFATFRCPLSSRHCYGCSS